MKTYTAKKIDVNSYTVDSNGKIHAVVLWECGHSHRSYETAQKCADQWRGTTRSLNMAVYDNDGNEYDCNGDKR